MCDGFAAFCCILVVVVKNGYIRHEGGLLHFVVFSGALSWRAGCVVRRGRVLGLCLRACERVGCGCGGVGHGALVVGVVCVAGRGAGLGVKRLLYPFMRACGWLWLQAL